MLIKHIVLSGGNYHGIQLLGAIFQAEEKLFKVSNIETVYGTSAGSIVLAIWLLRLEKSVVFDFIINRPWEKTYTWGTNIISNLFNKKGICDEKIINEILTPLLKSKYLDTDITLKRFYEITNIDFHIIATDVNSMQPIDFSHSSHPDVPLLDAVYMSASMPFIFKPKYFNDSLVIDGGLSLHFPVKPCIENGAKKENILGINIIKKTSYNSDETTPLGSYAFQLLFAVTSRLARLVAIDIPNLITIELDASLKDFPDIVADAATRERLWKNGEQSCDDFLQGSVQEFA